MRARVATFEDGDPAVIQTNIDNINANASAGPPEGIPSVGLMMLRQDDKVMAISLFETEEKLQEGHATLEAMSPPAGSLGRRVSVEFWDVALKLDAPGS